MSSVPDQVIGRYALFREIASGGMASVHLARLLGPAGFSRVVAIKRLHPHLARDPEFVTMFVDEARLAARIQHPNVVPTLDVVALEGELFIVMEYVDGESLARLSRIAAEKRMRFPVPVALSVVLGALHGLHAAHEARGEDGRPLELVHRDVSPHNVLVGVDGMARVVDFGIAKASGRSSRTASGVLKGKLPYMAPEQIRLEPIDRRTDIYAISVVLWELLCGHRLFTGDNDWDIATQIKRGVRTPPSVHNRDVSPALDAALLRGCALDPDRRFATALEMADAIEQAGPCAIARAVGRFVESLAADGIAQRRKWVAEAESVRSDVGLIGDEPLGTPTRPRSLSSETLTRPEGTRLGGVFAAAAAVSQPDVARVITRVDEAPATAATWVGPPARRLTPPLLGVIFGLLLAIAIGTVALIVKLARRTDDAAAVRAIDAPSVVAAPVVVDASASASVGTATPPERPVSAGAPPRPRVAAAKPPHTSEVQPVPTRSAPVKEPQCEKYLGEDGEWHFRNCR